MVEYEFSKLGTGVRFSSPAPSSLLHHKVKQTRLEWWRIEWRRSGERRGGVARLASKARTRDRIPPRAPCFDELAASVRSAKYVTDR